MDYTVGDVAKLTRVTVRALHHYDDIGLLVPSGRSHAGYRLYTEADLERLQQILLHRELGFALDEIATILRDPGFDRRAALHAQRARLVEKTEQLQGLVALVDRTLASLENGNAMAPGDLFGGFDPATYDAEVETRWGDHPAVAESKRRTKRYGPREWQAMRAEVDAVHTALVASLAAGARPTDRAVVDLAEHHRLHIDRWFYPCSHELHRSLGEMYVDDPRFTAHYERIHPGLTRFLAEAIRANAMRVRSQR